MLTLMLLLCAAPPAAEPRAVVELLPDGAELIVLPQPDAPTTSLRFVVRSGGSADPAEKEGLAHMLEHLLFHGSEKVDEDTVWRTARSVGAELNAYTSADHVRYVLDAPSLRFASVARMFISVLTSPALHRADVGRERQVISVERMLRGDLWLSMYVDALLFPGVSETMPIIGAQATRERITTDDLVRAYATYYTPSNTSFVFVGAITVEEARALVLGASGALPSLAEPPPPQPKAELSLPVQEYAPAPFTATIVGYEVNQRSDTCDDLARLLELRLLRAERGTALAELSATCFDVRGHELLVASASSSTFEGANLTELLARTARGLASQRMRDDERKLILRRARGQRAMMMGQSATLADALADRARLARGPGELTRAQAALELPRLDAASMARLAETYVRADREVRIELTPFKY